MEKIKNYLRRIYGLDALSCGCILLGVLINLVTSILVMRGFKKAAAWNLVSYLPLLICIWRCFSTSCGKRKAENDWFIGILDHVFEKKPDNAYGEEYRTAKSRERYREDKKQFKFFKCPACRQKIRVPRGKGRIEITCPRCGDKFIKKT